MHKHGVRRDREDNTCTTCLNAVLRLGNYVWYDLNKNGIQDSGETGLTGVTMNLYKDDNGDNVPDGTPIKTTITGAGGLYGFSSLTPGKYIVGVKIPTGYFAGVTTATSSSPDNDNNIDNNGVRTVSGEMRSNYITLNTFGEPTTDGDDSNGNLTMDFGLICGTAARVVVTKNTLGSNNDFKGFSVKAVYPNPFIDKVVISYTSEKAQKVAIRIYDNTGKTVYSLPVTVQAGKNNIQLTNLNRFPVGNYLIELKANDAVFTQKLMR